MNAIGCGPEVDAKVQNDDSQPIVVEGRTLCFSLRRRPPSIAAVTPEWAAAPWTHSFGLLSLRSSSLPLFRFCASGSNVGALAFVVLLCDRGYEFAIQTRVDGTGKEQRGTKVRIMHGG